jgi:hypothetical protein
VITFTIDPERHPAPIAGFRIVTPLANFEQRVRLERRQADGRWKALVKEGVLCDYTQWMDVRNSEIAVPDAWRRAPGGTFRITIDEATAEQRSQVTEVARSLAAGTETGVEERFRLVRLPFRIDRIEGWYDETVADRRAAEPVARRVETWTVDDDAKAKVTRIRLASAGGPLTALRLELADRNIARDVTVTGPPPPAEPGRLAARGNVIGRWMRPLATRETLGVSRGRLRGQRPGRALSTDSWRRRGRSWEGAGSSGSTSAGSSASSSPCRSTPRSVGRSRS